MADRVARHEEMIELDRLEYFGNTSLTTAAGVIESFGNLGVRAKIVVYGSSGVVVVRVVRDVAALLEEWIKPRKPAGICFIVFSDLRWWECWWTRVQYRESEAMCRTK